MIDARLSEPFFQQNAHAYVFTYERVVFFLNTNVLRSGTVRPRLVNNQ